MAVSQKRCKVGPKLLFMTNSKSYMRFRLVPKSPTLDDLELLKVRLFSEFCATSDFWEATTDKRMKVDLHCQRRNCCALKVIFNDIARRSSERGDLVSCVVHTKAVARSTLR